MNGRAVMKALALLVAFFVAGIGLVGLVAPYSFVSAGEYVITPAGLYAVAALRVGVGLLLLGMASASRMPKMLRVFGVVALVAGLTTPFFGVERSRAVMDWWAAQGPGLMRLLAALIVALGCFIAYVVSGQRRAA
jgi:hypothetical protein